MTCLSCVIHCAGCYPAQRKALIAFTEGSIGDDAFPQWGPRRKPAKRLWWGEAKTRVAFIAQGAICAIALSKAWGRAVATQAPSVKAVHRAITDENILPDLESQFVLD